MVFSSISFLFLYLPIVIILYWLTPSRFKNIVLLLASLVFYAFGEPFFIAILVFFIAINYVVSLFLISEVRSHTFRKILLTIGVLLNISLLIYYKYASFFIAQLVDAITFFQLPLKLEIPSIALPIGVSFFTFHGISYLVDVYRREVTASRSFTNLALYICLFPHLMAGPIVRFKNIADELISRKFSLEFFATGLQIFSFGLFKKLLIADNAGQLADTIFALPHELLYMPTAWLGAIAYTLQIYFDFSGYSDMAIGLALLFGFHFPQNFNHPYVASSMTDFWRRWHMSLSAWLRDYLYIPLGGNRGSSLKTYRNLLIIFFICGLWHGANWTFIVWGVWHGLFLVFERNNASFAKLNKPTRHVYTLLVVIVGWVFFRADNLTHATQYLHSMFNISQFVFDAVWLEHSTLWNFLIIFCGSIFSLNIFPNVLSKTQKVFGPEVLSLLAFAISIFLVVSSTYHPFLYFRF